MARYRFFGDSIDRISVFDPLTGKATLRVDDFTFYPAKQFVTPADKMKRSRFCHSGFSGLWRRCRCQSANAMGAAPMGRPG